MTVFQLIKDLYLKLLIKVMHLIIIDIYNIIIVFITFVNK